MDQMGNEMSLFQYQETAVEQLLTASQELLSSNQSQKYILLKAITGAGKTVMIASYIEKMCERYKDLTFIWVSVGSGALHEQSAKSLQALLTAHSVKFANQALTQPYLIPGDVLVLNWESLNTMKQDQEGQLYFDNVWMRDGERPNLKELWKKTRLNQTKIVLLIDESHYMAGSETAKRIIDCMNPVFTVEFTATPDKQRIPSREDELHGKAVYVPIPTEAVVEAGVIKKSIQINDSLQLEDNLDACRQLIHLALTRYTQLKKAYLLEGVDINPLCLIQLPNGKWSQDLLNTILDELKTKQITIENGRLAVWLNETKEGLEEVTALQSKVSFLIFKQAIATGWDCPRASVLVKLRETKSETFDLQTIGRILRMPERHHYHQDVLNHGYILTNADYTCQTDHYSQILPTRQVLKEEYRDDVLNLQFPITKKEAGIFKLDEAVFERKVQEQLKLMTFDDDFSKLHHTFTTFHTDSTKLEAETSSEHEQTVVTSAYTDEDINFDYQSFLFAVSKGPYTPYFIDAVLHRYFMNETPYQTSHVIRQMVLLNQWEIKQVLQTTRHEMDKKQPATSRQDWFSFEEERYTSTKETINYHKCAYQEHFVSKWKTEQRFEAFLETLDQVKWWIKNVDSGHGVSLVYEYEEDLHEFYPDYVVGFNDGQVGLYEVKDFNDKEKTTVTAVKIVKLKEYMATYHYLGGLVEIYHDNVYLQTLPKELLKK